MQGLRSLLARLEEALETAAPSSAAAQVRRSSSVAFSLARRSMVAGTGEASLRRQSSLAQQPPIPEDAATAAASSRRMSKVGCPLYMFFVRHLPITC